MAKNEQVKDDILNILIKEHLETKWYQYSKRSVLNTMIKKAQTDIQNEDAKLGLSNLKGKVVNISQSIESFLTPSSDIRIYDIEARDELAINLVKSGYIKITNVEGKRNGLDIVTVTASINVKK